MNPYGEPSIKKDPIPDGRIFSEARGLESPVVTYTISARGKSANVPVFGFLRNQYGNIPLREIESIFGFVQRSTLYGGRIFGDRELSDRDVTQLNNAGIGIRIPMSNHYVHRSEYLNNRRLLDQYELDINSIIITNDDLARWIRRDYPRYSLDGSVIKNLKTHDKIEAALDLYDSVVLPMRLNEDFEFLEKIAQKDRIILFANAGCALTCPSKLCYPSISKLNKFRGGEFQCSQPIKERERLGMVDFPLEPYVDMGFHHFKLLRARPNNMTGY
ncbi:MAG: hypothetical protein OEY08_18910 [Gammaproteobacteria bacterium]|nr:hypothetical protein [Gammaproteobacteria bacterium]